MEHPDPACKLSANLYDIYHCCVYSEKLLMMDRGTVQNIVNQKVQLDATVRRHLFTAKSLYMFRVSQHPSSGVLKTVSATSGIGHDTGTATSVAVPVS